MKLCKDCKWCDYKSNYENASRCTRGIDIFPENIVESPPSPISGNTTQYSKTSSFCNTLRGHHASAIVCGPEAKYFEPIEPKLSIWKRILALSNNSNN